jgi:hypothetical protein
MHVLVALFTLMLRKPLFTTVLERPIATLYPSSCTEDIEVDSYTNTRLLVNDIFEVQHTEFGQTIEFFHDASFDKLFGDLRRGPFHQLAEQISLSASSYSRELMLLTLRLKHVYAS